MILNEEGFIKVRIGGDVVRRPSYAVPVIDPLTRRMVGIAYKPELQSGEVLLEVIGDLPRILTTHIPT